MQHLAARDVGPFSRAVSLGHSSARPAAAKASPAVPVAVSPSLFEDEGGLFGPVEPPSAPDVPSASITGVTPGAKPKAKPKRVAPVGPEAMSKAMSTCASPTARHLVNSDLLHDALRLAQMRAVSCYELSQEWKILRAQMGITGGGARTPR